MRREQQRLDKSIQTRKRGNHENIRKIVDKPNWDWTISSLSRHLGLDRKTVKKRVDKLVEKGDLVRSRVLIRAGSGRRRWYFLAPKRIYKIEPPHIGATIIESLVPI